MQRPSTVDERNAETSRLEVAAFKAEKPARYFAYHAPARMSELRSSEVTTRIVTWMGDDLARVTSRGDVYRSNFGDRRQSFRALAINGETYSGVAYLDAGDYVRMRKVKS